METKTTRRLATALEALRLISDETVSATTLSMRLADRTLGSFKVLDVVQWGICGQFGDSRGFIAARTNDGQEWLIVRSEQGAQVQRALDKPAQDSRGSAEPFGVCRHQHAVVTMNPKHGFLLAAAEWFHHCLRCLPPGESCEHHAPECEDGKALFEHMRQLSGEET